jgi:SAM-dependent methyltransferase
MSQILTAERELYDGVWSSLESYGDCAPGEFYAPLFLQHVNGRYGHVLDAGCGSGKGALALAKAGLRVTLCDLTDAGLVDEARALPFVTACLWHDLKRATPSGSVDWVFCCDVLEHIPSQFTMLAIDQMLRIARQGVFLGIALVPDSFGAWVGRPLHQTVQPFQWWRDSLKELGDVVDARDLFQSAAYFVVPR